MQQSRLTESLGSLPSSISGSCNSIANEIMSMLYPGVVVRVREDAHIQHVAVFGMS